MAATRTEVKRHHSEHSEWEMAARAPDPRLAAHVEAVYAYREIRSLHGASEMRELPWPGAVLILNLGPPLDFLDPDDRAAPRASHGSFAAGLGDRHVIFETPGLQRGVQANLTPLGAYRFFGMPMDALANCIVELDDVLGAEAARLVERMAAETDPDAQLDLVEDVVAARIERGPVPTAEVAWALGRLRETDGCTRIGALADELGWSRKRLIARFREQVGLPPKRLARLFRFHRVVRTLERDETRLAEVAYACGFADQSHLDREFRSFSGTTPSEFLAAYSRRV